jgi:hypothetical protein
LYVPSNASLAHCPTSCGNVSFSYPLGTAPGCFRQGFELTCDHTFRPPRLFWLNSTVQILDASNMANPIVYGSIGFSITMTAAGTSTYTRSWESPAKGLSIDSDNSMYVVGCNVEVILFDTGTNLIVGSCGISICLGHKSLMRKEVEAVDDGDRCNRLGCCSISYLPRYMRGFRFTLSRRNGIAARSHAIVKVFLAEGYEFDTSDLYSSWINASIQTRFDMLATDQPSCEIASTNKGTYACSTGSSCETAESPGYYCYCNTAVAGSDPYILDGCIEGP